MQGHRRHCGFASLTFDKPALIAFYYHIAFAINFNDIVMKRDNFHERSLTLGKTLKRKTDAVNNYIKGMLKSTGSICHEHAHHGECGE